MARRRNPLLTIVTNPPPIMGQVHSISYRHAEDGHDYIHEFGPSVDMKALDDGYLSIKHGSGDVLHRKDESGQTFLVNPPSRRRTTMATKRLPPRVKSGKNKGQFRKRATSKRRSPAKKRRRNMGTKTAAAANPHRRRNNPPRRGKFTIRKVTRDLTQGAMDAVLIVVGKAGARTIPTMLPNLPKEGNVGLAVQALVAVVIGLAADMVLKPAQSKMVMAGGLTAPIETLVVSLDVPFLADALGPTEAAAQVGAYYGYVQPPQIESGDIGAYVQEGADVAMSGYDYALDA